MSAPVRILGVDPGLNTTGYAVIEVHADGPKLIEAGTIRSAERRATPDMAQRLKALYDGVIEVIDQFGPTALAVEQLYAQLEARSRGEAPAVPRIRMPGALVRRGSVAAPPA